MRCTWRIEPLGRGGQEAGSPRLVNTSDARSIEAWRRGEGMWRRGRERATQRSERECAPKRLRGQARRGWPSIMATSETRPRLERFRVLDEHLLHGEEARRGHARLRGEGE
eukprot:1894418-Pleurochrysis_carterae.AAC.1